MRNKNLLPAVFDPFLKVRLPLLLSTLSFSAFSQTNAPDSASDGASQAMYKQYMARINGAAVLYSGAEYEGAYPRVLGSPFWKDYDFQQGTVCYEGIVYYGVPLAYELVRNELLIKGFQQLSQRLEKAKVNYFVLAGHTYVHLADTTGKNKLPDDFYDLLYDGTVRAYAKRTKTVAKAFSAESQDSIRSRNLYFLYKDGVYHSLQNAADLPEALGVEKKAFRDFWKDQDVNFKKDPETFIIQTAKHWEQMKK